MKKMGVDRFQREHMRWFIAPFRRIVKDLNGNSGDT